MHTFELIEEAVRFIQARCFAQAQSWYCIGYQLSGFSDELTNKQRNTLQTHFLIL